MLSIRLMLGIVTVSLSSDSPRLSQTHHAICLHQARICSLRTTITSVSQSARRAQLSTHGTGGQSSTVERLHATSCGSPDSTSATLYWHLQSRETCPIRSRKILRILPPHELLEVQSGGLLELADGNGWPSEIQEFAQLPSSKQCLLEIQQWCYLLCHCLTNAFAHGRYACPYWRLTKGQCFSVDKI